MVKPNKRVTEDEAIGKLLKSKLLGKDKKTPLRELECSSDPNDWRPTDGPHPSD